MRDHFQLLELLTDVADHSAAIRTQLGKGIVGLFGGPLAASPANLNSHSLKSNRAQSRKWRPRPVPVSTFDTLFGNLPLTEQAPYSLDTDSADPGLFEKLLRP